MSKTKRDLEAELASVRDDLTQTEQFLDRWKKNLDGAYAAQNRVMELHSPYVDRNTILSDGLQEGLLILRCRICRTPEHHTYGPLNDAPWPCPTVQAFMDLSPFQTQESA